MQAHTTHAPTTANGFLPHGYCFLWNKPLVLTHVVSDVAIGLSYVVISFVLALLVHRARKDIPFSFAFIAFGLFIVTCGLTHFLDVWTLWYPSYWLLGGAKAVTAVASLSTAIAMPFMLPHVHATIQNAKRGRTEAAAAARAEALAEQNARLEEQSRELEARRQHAEGLAQDLALANAELRRMAAEAQRARDEIEATYRTAPIGLCVLDREGRFIRINERMAEMTGIPAAAHLGRTVREALPDLAPVVEPVLSSIVTSGHPILGVEVSGVTGRDQPEKRHWVESWHPLHDASGAVVAVNIVAEDVTARKRAERERERLLEAERQAREDAERARQEAETASRAKGDFLAVMSHELRTPLNAIGGYAELLHMELHGPVTAAQREALERIQRSQRHLLSIINDVLNFTRIERASVQYRLQPVPLAPLISSALPFLDLQRRAKHIAVDVRLPEPGQTCADAVVADADKLQQVLLNLLGNAIKFTPDGGQVTIELADAPDEHGRAVLRIRDTGIGIPPTQVETIFEPFTQVGRAFNHPIEGTGLGLAISRDLTRGMGGDLTVESTPNVGSTFTVLLPCVRDGDAIAA